MSVLLLGLMIATANPAITNPAEFKARMAEHDAAWDARWDCIEKRAKSYLLQRETAATIADIAIAACSDERDKELSAAKKITLDDQTAEKALNDEDVKLKTIFMQEVMDWRNLISKKFPNVRQPWQ